MADPPALVPVMVEIGASLPKPCARCGSSEALRKQRAEFRLAAWWAIPLMWVPFARGLGIRKGALAFWLCEDCQRQSKRASAIGFMAVAATLGAVFLPTRIYLGWLGVVLPLIVGVTALFLVRRFDRRLKLHPFAIDPTTMSFDGIARKVARRAEKRGIAWIQRSRGREATARV